MTTNGSVTSYIASLWKVPEAVEIFTTYLSNLNTTPNHVLVADSAPFQVDLIQCLYPTSGRYSPMLRVMFYSLSVVSLFFAKDEWIAGVTMAYVMIYSTVA